MERQRLGSPRALEQGKADRSEGTVQAQRNLGHPGSTTDAGAQPGACAVRPRHRQQAARMRSRSTARAGCMPRRPGCSTGDRVAAEDAASGPVRDHTSNTGRAGGLDQTNWAEIGGLPVPEPHPQFAASWDAPVFADRRWVGQGDRARPISLRHALDAPDEGFADLSADQEPAGGAAAARPHEIGEHGPVSWHRGRRCTGDRRADGGLTNPAPTPPMAASV